MSTDECRPAELPFVRTNRGERAAVVDYYRCPAEFTQIESHCDLSSRSGFFAFDGITCFGQTANRRALRQEPASLVDVAGDVRTEGSTISLPFDVSQVAENLRQEKYRLHAPTLRHRVLSSAVARKTYYFLRPALSVYVRRHFQRARLKGWQSTPFPRWPVDLSVDSLMHSAMKLRLQVGDLESIPFIWFWPDGAPSCAIVTHDVESSTGRAFSNRLMDIDADAGFYSSFQVIPTGRYTDSKQLCAEVRARGFEVNVHDFNHDGRLFEERTEFLRRSRLINEYGAQVGSRGFRSGAMYRNQAWFDAFQFSYDMSVPNVAHLEPQNGGCCTVMPYFVGNVLELPLTTVQDYSLFHILKSYSTDLWREQIDLIREHHGLITILSHPDYLVDSRAVKAYGELLAYVARLRDREGLWTPLPGDVDRWWRARHEMRLVRQGSSWRVEGPESHRARLAHARLDQGKVVYSVTR